jgi:hypothetical protein
VVFVEGGTVTDTQRLAAIPIHGMRLPRVPSTGPQKYSINRAAYDIRPFL